MPTPLPTPIDRARAAWLAGSPDAWTQYRACLRRLEAALPAPAPVPPRPRLAPRAQA